MFPEMWTYHVNSGQWKEVPPQQLGDPFAVRRSSALVVGTGDDPLDPASIPVAEFDCAYLDGYLYQRVPLP